MIVTPDRARSFPINVRIPGWARNEPVPSDLYSFMNKVDASATIKVNGQNVPLTLSKGYVTIERAWKPGDTIELVLPMPVRRVLANQAVVADRDRVAFQRGPIVYAAEWPDNANGKVRNIVVPDNATLTTEFRKDLLNGVQVVKTQGFGLSYDEKGAVKKAAQEVVAIPYATWANRGRGQMAVWLARTDAAARPTPFPTIATTSKITTSPSRRNAANIIDGEEPANSADASAYFDWWPRRGCKPGVAPATPPAGAQGQQPQPCSESEWIEMTFAKPSSVSEAQVYWFDDTGRGSVRVPQTWRLLYRDGETWKPVEAAGAYGTARDAWNTVTFKPVTTTALRLELTMQPDVSAGVQEWKVK
jgi:hypothetical protein